jgi:hypothetical protein
VLVADHGRTRGVGADVIAHDDVAGRAVYDDALQRVAGDDVAGDRVVVGSAGKLDPGRAIGERGGAVPVRADEIVPDQVPIGTLGEDPLPPAPETVPGDDVVGDRVAGGIEKPQAGVAVADPPGAGRVGADVVALDERVDDAVQEDAVHAVAGDDVARAGDVPANGVAVGRTRNPDPGQTVGQRGAAAGVRADEVALDNVVGGAVAGDLDAVAVVARDDVARAQGGPADEVVPRAAGNEDAVVGVAEVGGPVAVGADVVALDDVAERARGADLNAGAVAGDDVALRGRDAADRVPAAEDVDADAGVPKHSRARAVGADVVAEDAIVVARGIDLDAVQLVSGDDVALSRGDAADDVAAAVDQNAVGGVVVASAGRRAVGVEAPDAVADDDVVVRAGLEPDPVALEVPDHEALDRAAARVGREREAATHGVAAVDHDHRVAAGNVTGRRPAVDENLAVDGRQRAGRQADRAGDSEHDRVRSDPVAVRIEDRLAQAARARVCQAVDRERREQVIPLALHRQAHHHRRVDLAGPVLQVPVPAEARASRRVVARGDVCSGEFRDPVDERAAARGLGQVAAVEEDVGVGLQRVAPRRHRLRIGAKRLGVEPRPAELHGAVGAVRDEMNGVDLDLALERLGHLRDSGTVRVEGDDLEAPTLARLRGELGEELRAVRDPRVDEDDLVGALDRRDRRSGHCARPSVVGERTELGTPGGRRCEQCVVRQRIEVRRQQEPRLELLEDRAAKERNRLPARHDASGGRLARAHRRTRARTRRRRAGPGGQLCGAFPARAHHLRGRSTRRVLSQSDSAEKAARCEPKPDPRFSA